MNQQQLMDALARMDFMELLDTYFRAKTGHRCFSDEVLPPDTLHLLHELESFVHHYNARQILNKVAPEA